MKGTELSIRTPQTEIQKALSGTLVRASSDRDINNIIVAAHARAVMMTGQTPDEKEIGFMVSTLPELIRRDFPSMRIEELPLAVEKGILGEYGDYFGINVATFIKFIKGYQQSRDRMEAVKQLSVPEPEKPAPSPAELKKMEDEMLVNAFYHFDEFGYYEDYGNHVYKKLDERGLIPFTLEVKKEIMEQARKELLRENQPENAKSKSAHRQMTRFVKQLIEHDSNSHVAIQSRAMQIALKRFFKELQGMDTHIEDLLS